MLTDLRHVHRPDLAHPPSPLGLLDGIHCRIEFVEALSGMPAVDILGLVHRIPMLAGSVRHGDELPVNVADVLVRAGEPIPPVEHEDEGVDRAFDELASAGEVAF